MRKYAILLGVVLLALVLASAADAKKDYEKALFVNLNYNNGALSLQGVNYGHAYIPSFVESAESARMGFDKAAIGLYSGDNSLLYMTYFYIETKRFVDYTDESGEMSGGLEEISNSNITVIVPYFKDAEKLDIRSIYGGITVNDLKKRYKLPKEEMPAPAIYNLYYIFETVNFLKKYFYLM